MEIPADWAAAVDELVRRPRRRVMVLGRPGSGKSTLCRLLVSRVRGSLLLDTDVGQKLAGPPGVVSLHGGAGEEILPPHAMAFVGAADPMGHYLPLVMGALKLAQKAQPNPLVINTSGFVDGAGRGLKAWKIEALEPDLLIALERQDEMRAILADYPSLPCLRLKVAGVARNRSTAQRRAARRDAFAAYFAGARLFSLPAGRLVRHRVPRGEPLGGLLCALCDGWGGMLGLGVLKAAPEGPLGPLDLLTPCDPDGAEMLVGGSLRLEEG
ncbi:Clp1/GlmU family protein [Telmatospirillum sp. J64-1]|uniref:Clp1/GlmU family protein n=1 Tax=Telmatospirillum sp. J64-1 TaxID=2502183 RepID=UPI00115F34F7|nr:Clp1/GlmU family protein [Telmatospirillum sp. J64-1]